MRGLIEGRMSFLEAVDQVNGMLTEQDVRDPKSWMYKLGRWFAGKQAGEEQRGEQSGAALRKILPTQTGLENFAAQVAGVEQGLNARVGPVMEWAQAVASGKYATKNATARMPRWGKGSHTIRIEGTDPDQPVGPDEKIKLMQQIVAGADKVDLIGALNEARGELSSLWQVLESVYGDASPEVRHLENRWQQPVNQWGRMLREIEEAELALTSDPDDADRSIERAFQRLAQMVVQILESQEELNFWFVQVMDLLESVRLAGFTRATMPVR